MFSSTIFILAQNSPPPASEKPVVSDVQPNVQLNVQPRVNRNSPEAEKLRKEIQDCPECQAHKKHMQEKHGIVSRGPLAGPREQGRGQNRPSQNPPRQ